MGMRIKVLRAHYYGSALKQPGDVYDCNEPIVHTLISSAKAEQTTEPVGAARPAPAPRPAAKPKPKPAASKEYQPGPEGDEG